MPTQTFGPPIPRTWMCGACGETPAPTNEDGTFKYVLRIPAVGGATRLCHGCYDGRVAYGGDVQLTRDGKTRVIEHL